MKTFKEIEQVIEDFRDGKFVIIVDDEDPKMREILPLLQKNALLRKLISWPDTAEDSSALPWRGNGSMNSRYL